MTKLKVRLSKSWFNEMFFSMSYYRMPVNFFKNLPRPSVTPWLFNIIAALLITVVQNVVYFRKILQLVDVSTAHNLLFIASMPVTLLVGLNLIFSLILLPYIRKPIVIFLFIIDAFAQYFMQAYGVLID